MPADDIRALSEARYEHADECLHAAKSLLHGGDYKSAANRAYYAIFHAMRSVFAYDGIDMKHHSGIISSFRRLYIKTDTSMSDCQRLFPNSTIYERAAIMMISLSSAATRLPSRSITQPIF